MISSKNSFLFFYGRHEILRLKKIKKPLFLRALLTDGWYSVARQEFFATYAPKQPEAPAVAPKKPVR